MTRSHLIAFVCLLTVGAPAIAQDKVNAPVRTSHVIPVASGKAVKAEMFVPASADPVPGILVLPTYYAAQNGRAERFDFAYAEALAREGYATLVPVLNQYGLRSFHFGMAPDVASISKWFRDRPEVMDDRIGAVGFSQGAEQSGNLAAFDPTTRAVIGYYGNYDSQKFARAKEDKPTGAHYTVDKISPRTGVLLLHGRSDNEISFEYSVRYHEKLVAAGKQAEIVLYPGAFHRFERGPVDGMPGNTDRNGYVYVRDEAARDDSWRRSVAWFKKYMW